MSFSMPWALLSGAEMRCGFDAETARCAVLAAQDDSIEGLY